MSLNNFAKQSIELRKTRREISKHLKFHRLGSGEFEVLNLLKDERSTQPSNIATDLEHDYSAISRIVYNLFKSKYISYNNDEDDRRRVFVCITDCGLKKLELLSKSDADI